MSRTILVELTEKEVEALENGLIKEKASLEDARSSEIGKTAIEKKLEGCNSAWAKLDNAKRVKPDAIITNKDLFLIKSMAKSEYNNLSNDLHISKKKVEEEDFVHISLANALIMWLNSKNLLKRLAVFDYTDESFKYDGNEE